MTDAPDKDGPWYVYHLDEDGQESEVMYYEYDKALARFDDLDDRGFYETLTLLTYSTVDKNKEEDAEEESSGGCGCLILIILLFAIVIGAGGAIRVI